MKLTLPALLLVLSSACPAARAADPTYWQDVRPVLRKYCTACHSAKNLKEVDVSGGLALDTFEAVRKGGKQPVVVTGKSADSLLVKLVVTDDAEKRMPQGASPLPADTINLLRRWIDTGAKEGTKPNDTTTVAAAPRRTKRLDVTLPTNATPPAGLFGKAKPAALQLTLAVGPLTPVAAVAFSPDGALLAAGTYSRVTVWDVTTAQPVKQLTNVLGAVNDVRFSPDGTLLAVAGGQPSAKGDLRIYQVADWKLLATLTGHDDVVFSIAFHPDGKRLASASFDKTVRVWDVATHKTLSTHTGHSDFVYSVAFSPDGKWLASASKDRSVKLVEADTGKSRFTLSLDDDVLTVAVSPDGKSVVSSGFQPSLYWWDPATGQRVRAQGGHGVATHEVCFSKDGKLVASAGADRTVRFWNGSTGAAAGVAQAGSVAYAVALSPDGKRVAAGCFDGMVRVWETTSARPLVTLLALPPDGDGYDWLAVTPEGYTAGSAGLTALGQWRMAGQAVASEGVWKALRQPDAVAKALRGEAVAAPAFAK